MHTEMGDAGAARGGCKPAKLLMWYETKHLGKQKPRWTFNGVFVATWGELTIQAVTAASLGEDTWKGWHTKATPVSNDGYIPSPVPNGGEWPVRGVVVMTTSQLRHSCTAGPALAELEEGCVPGPLDGGPRLLSPEATSSRGGRRLCHDR